MPAKPRVVPRQTRPEREHDYVRSPQLGYEAPEETGVVRCLSHGFPTPLARWHYHDEYELHLITSTSGKAFVGDWIGQFHPGHLVLAGPRLPHNWVSMDVPEGGVELRDLVIQFPHEPLANAAAVIPELAEVLPLLERARHGIEFFGQGERAQQHWGRVKASRGARRFAAFCDFLADLAACTDYRLLSDFVNLVRINRACQLLMESDKLITHICYEVGFNNVANFNRRFLEIKGMTPSEFRRQAEVRFGTAM